MEEKKTIICLANSRKQGGRCVAGVDIDDRTWVRPGGDRPNRTVLLPEQRLADGSDTRVGDAVTVGLIAPQPEGYQTENWLLDGSVAWASIGRADWDVISDLEETPNGLWIDGYSSGRGENDRVPAHRVTGLTTSLTLIHVTQFDLIYVEDPFGKQVRARFRYGVNQYSLRVTDPFHDVPFETKDAGVYTRGEAFLTVSLTPPYADDGAAYKLVAAIIEPASVG